MQLTQLQQHRLDRLYYVIVNDEWDEANHPRKKNGQFGKGGEKHSIAQSNKINTAVIKADRRAATFDEARKQAKEFQGKKLINNDSHLTAVASRNSLDKMLSSKAVNKSASPQLQALAVANTDKLYENALYGWSKPDRSNDPNIVAVHRLFSVLETGKEQYLVKLTVKEIARRDQENKFYTIETVELNEKSPAAQWVDSTVQADGLDPTSIRSVGDIHSLAKIVQKSNINARLDKLLGNK
ncbi:hypothetical protein BKK51_12295 [Rodentibacter trehalosifermentans]|uniref:Large polyvalent protein-associated domain-containing protein n=1 Tax=Rodentibacter trehalosifermentans TaxID=1908263 RepID=A0A1V3IYY7_9PAST|nr:hypothetical protein [Rodentibacter trehalosifermentans]OOF42927.1 hypothetical protein BKK51_12295 [Rodentibacter trehalosifermentans]OOF47452.1 hypothetical protein BKK52_09205 [Rodentibacter trehalosifermentans]